MRTILASASPRRRELLHLLVEDFEVCPANGEEERKKTIPEELVKDLAQQKAMEVAARFKNECRQESIRVIGSDTVVTYQGKIYGKPADEKDALRMLLSLQGNTHQVYTGVCVIDLLVDKEIENGESCSENKIHMEITCFAEKTDVTMYPVSEEELRRYLHTGESENRSKGRVWDTHNGHQPEWYDKAGGYAVQGMSAKFIKELRGDYFNVVGLPVGRLYQECYKGSPQ